MLFCKAETYQSNGSFCLIAMPPENVPQSLKTVASEQQGLAVCQEECNKHEKIVNVVFLVLAT